jgi:hypothetical protein
VDNYKEDLKEIEREGVDVIHVAKDGSCAADIHDEGAFGCTNS